MSLWSMAMEASQCYLCVNGARVWRGEEDMCLKQTYRSGSASPFIHSQPYYLFGVF